MRIYINSLALALAHLTCHDMTGPNGRVAPVDRENKLFVGMLPHDADDMTLTEVFSRFGEITEVCLCVCV